MEDMNMTEQVKMTEDEYLSLKGVGFCVSDYNLDKTRLPHGETLRQQRKRYEQENIVATEYYSKRNEARKEYQQLVKEGKIIPKTVKERTIERANGHPDNESTQAARRMCEKRGWNWRN